MAATAQGRKEHRRGRAVGDAWPMEAVQSAGDFIGEHDAGHASMFCAADAIR